jgi:hypothetical protein
MEGGRPSGRPSSIASLIDQLGTEVSPAEVAVLEPLSRGCANEERRVPRRLGLPQHANQHRPERPVLLAVDQELCEGAALWLAPELSDPVGPVEVRKHEDVEQLSAGSRPEGVQLLLESALQFVGSHARRPRGHAAGAEAASRLRERRSKRDQCVERG